VRRIDGADALIVWGVLLLAAGLAAYDWRIALIVMGIISLALGLVAATRGAK
jgi:hypothetical protein